jgi:hypothetical protein
LSVFDVQFRASLLLASLICDLATPHSLLIFKQTRLEHANFSHVSKYYSLQILISLAIILSRQTHAALTDHTALFVMRFTIRFALATLPLLAVAQDNSSSATAVDIVPITIDGTAQLSNSQLTAPV